MLAYVGSMQNLKDLMEFAYVGRIQTLKALKDRELESILKDLKHLP